MQNSWDKELSQFVYEDIKNNADQIHLACLKSAAAPYSGSWLQALPNPTIGTYLDDDSLRIGVALRIGARICETHRCRCGQTIDTFGHHPLSCKRSAGRFPRHAALNDIFKRALQRAGIPSVLEPTGLDRGDGKRPDGMTTFPYALGRSLIWDATCTDTFSNSALIDSALNSGTAAAQAEDKKIRKYHALCENYIFEPLAFETSGAIGPRTLKTLTKLGLRLSQAKDEPREKAWLMQRFSIAIVRGNAQSILRAAS